MAKVVSKSEAIPTGRMLKDSFLSRHGVIVQRAPRGWIRGGVGVGILGLVKTALGLRNAHLEFPVAASGRADKAGRQSSAVRICAYVGACLEVLFFPFPFRLS